MQTFFQFITETPEQDAAKEWREHGWNRRTMTQLAKKAVKGGPLHHLHPGHREIYRGQGPESAHHTKVGTSWSKHKKVAKDYADGHTVHKLKIYPHTPAIDVNKLLKGHPSKSQKDHEVFVAAGKYKTKKIV